MEFNLFHKDFFSATTGAFSRVTERENYDSQITLTDIEAKLVIQHFGLENIHIGNVTSDKIKSQKLFSLFPTLEPISLNLVFPKPEKTELRLYLSTRAGFKPLGGQIWFIYLSLSGSLVIGYMNEIEWNRIGQNDELDNEYQANIEEEISKNKFINSIPEGRIATTTSASRVIYQRNPQIAVMRFKAAQYKCEINPEHNTFISQATNLPYMEAHHFIPIKFQHLFEIPLDNFDNVMSLCPTCHRGIHLAVRDYKYNLIQRLYQKRHELHNFTLEEIAQFYNCIEISNS